MIGWKGNMTELNPPLSLCGVLLSLSISILLLAAVITPAVAAEYTIDGDLDDWGVNPSNNSWDAAPPALSVYENWRPVDLLLLAQITIRGLNSAT